LIGAGVNYNEQIYRLQSQLECWLSPIKSNGDRPTQEELEQKTLHLLKLRNKKAVDLKFSNFFDLVLTISETGTKWFKDYLQLVDEMTIKPYVSLVEEYKQTNGIKKLSENDVRQLFMNYYLITQGPQLPKDTYTQLYKKILADIGINYDPLPIQILEKKMPDMISGQGLAIEIPQDFRIVIKPDLSFRDRMHEIGHGLHSVFTQINNPILKGYEWCLGNDCGAYSEGMAEIISGFTQNPDWLVRVAGLSESEVSEKKNILKKYAPAFLRFQLFLAVFEMNLYKDPDQNLHDLQNSLAAKYLLIEKPIERPVSLANMMHVSYPAYSHNYMLAEVLSWQVHEFLKVEFGKDYPFNREVGDFLIKHFYRDGQLYHWQTRIKHALGKSLDVEGYLHSYN
jgi:hypothetical protein